MKTLARGNDWQVIVRVVRDDVDTGRVVPATGIVGLSAWLSSTADGSPWAGTTVTLTESAGVPGRYTGTIDVAAIDAATATTPDGVTVWEVVSQTGGLRQAWARRFARVRGGDEG